MVRAQVTRKLNNDKGFSLVELIIVVSILAIAAVPLMKSMGMAAKTNAKAQSIQNATSLGESIMEEMKSTPIDKLKSKYGTDFSGGVMTIKMLGDDGNGISATQGEKFIATVTINTNEYSDDTDTSTEAGKVIAANVLKLPAIEEIDTLSQAVMSSIKEFNKYDKAAQSYFNEKKADYDPTLPATAAAITSKTVNIIKTNVTGGYNGVSVKASVTYEDNATPKNTYVRDLYTGSFIAEKKDDDTYKNLDSNIYLFYKRGSDIPSTVQETINIKDSSTPTVDSDSLTDSHRVYFIRQDISDVDGPVITFERSGTGTFAYSNIGDLADGIGTYGGIKFITNLGSTVSASDGHIYKEEERIRVYSVEVVLTKKDDSTEYARLKSTVNVSDPTPTAAPTPTT